MCVLDKRKNIKCLRVNLCSVGLTKTLNSAHSIDIDKFFDKVKYRISCNLIYRYVKRFCINMNKFLIKRTQCKFVKRAGLAINLGKENIHCNFGARSLWG